MKTMTKTINVGNIKIGGGNRISVQSMTNTDTANYEKTLEQICELEKAGCDIVRLAVGNDADIESCKKLISAVSVPLVADIQFDYRIAIKCAEIGFSKIRINPGNIGSPERVKAVVDACKTAGIPIRVGVNSGSLDKDIYSKYGNTPKALVESAMKHVRLLENFNFYDIVISVKASSVPLCVQAYRLLSQSTDYPLHIGITESGGGESALLKSAIGIGSLLLDGIGDTVRVSLSDSPVEEVYAAKKILRAAGIDKNYCEIVSCPTCSRCKYDLIGIVREMQDYVKDIRIPMKIAVMGCVVNGPGEAKDCDFGVAGGGDKAVLFEKGEIIKTIPTNNVIPELKRLIDVKSEEYKNKK